jgi:hypothetical protein
MTVPGPGIHCTSASSFADLGSGLHTSLEVRYTENPNTRNQRLASSIAPKAAARNSGWTKSSASIYTTKGACPACIAVFRSGQHLDWYRAGWSGCECPYNQLQSDRLFDFGEQSSTTNASHDAIVCAINELRHSNRNASCLKHAIAIVSADDPSIYGGYY